VHRASTAKGSETEVPLYSLAERNRRRALPRKLVAAEEIQALIAQASLRATQVGNTLGDLADATLAPLVLAGYAVVFSLLARRFRWE
jgi:hypothetical protein